MQRAFQQFEKNFDRIKELDELHSHLQGDLKFPNDLSDLLRAEVVYAVSALDKLIHELVQDGMVKTFLGIRLSTKKYNGFTISAKTLEDIRNADIPPAEFYFEREVARRNKALSFQDPDKISDALSYIWDESHKWQKITNEIGATDQKAVKERLGLIVDRRNQIVHEADTDYLGSINPITQPDCQEIVRFVYSIGKAIFNLVK